MTKLQTNETQLAVIVEKVNNIEHKVTNIENKLERDYVTQDQFQPVRNIVYGLVGLILLSVVGALLTLILSK